MSGKGKNGKGKITVHDNDTPAVTMNENPYLATKQADYFNMDLADLGKLLADPSLNENQRDMIVKAIVAKNENREKTEREKAVDYLDKCKVEIVNQLSSFLATNGLNLAKIKDAIGYTTEGKPKESVSLINVTRDYKVSDLVARRLEFSLTVTDRLPKKVMRKLSKDAAFKLHLREQEAKRQAEIDRLWAEWNQMPTTQQGPFGV